ncbi:MULTISPECIES: hypothetical protein [Nocardia]|uniref:hypothetical protein n=1 Tax=Nocardia TaxID=1817 RepID=UPI000D69F4F2|nr:MULTISPECIES: hypothetical protein [Nocardia]
MDSQTLLVEAIKKTLPDMPVAHVETWARDIAGIIDGQGLALVKLPAAVTDDFGDPRWPVSEVDKFAAVKLDEHGRIASLGVGNPASPKLALRQAAAMIAAARHVKSAD